MRSGYRTILLVLMALIVMGCNMDSEGPCTVPLVLKDEQSDKPVSEAVVVSLVLSTGWFHYLTIDSQPHPRDKLRIEKIDRVNSPNPSAYLPFHWPAAGLGYVGWVINEDPELMVFAPGFHTTPSMIRVTIGGEDTLRTYIQAAYQDTAGVKILLRSLSAESGMKNKPAGFLEGQETLVGDKPPAVLDRDTFWQQLKKWYDGGRNRAEIELICTAVLKEADSFVQKNPQHAWSLDQQTNLDWCRWVLSSRP